MGEMTLTAWRQAVRPDLPGALILLNALERNQTCNPVLLRSTQFTAGVPHLRTRSGSKQGPCSVALHPAPSPFISVLVPLDLQRTSCLAVSLFPSSGFCCDTGNVLPVCHGWCLMAAPLKIWTSFEWKSNTLYREWGHHNSKAWTAPGCIFPEPVFGIYALIGNTNSHIGLNKRIWCRSSWSPRWGALIRKMEFGWSTFWFLSGHVVHGNCYKTEKHQASL